MKRKIALLAILAGAMLMSACVGVNHIGVFDESVPEQNQCLLEVRNNLSVILFNNQPVSWESGLTKDTVSIYVPPGENTFVVTYVQTRNLPGSNLVTHNTVSNTVSMEFLPGHSYQIYKRDIWLVFLTVTTVGIKEVPVKK